MSSAAEPKVVPTTVEAEEPKRSGVAETIAYYAEELKDLSSVLSRTLYYTMRGSASRKAVVQQCYAIGNESLFFMSVTMGFIGAIIVFQMATQMLRVVPDLSMLGGTYLKLLIRDLGPSVGAMPLATRVGAGIAAQIGSMVVTEQTDALRMTGADPIDYLVVPRFIASTIMGTIILFIGCIVAWVAGMVIANVQFDVNIHTYINFRFLTLGDCILGFLKCLSYGGAMAIVSSQRGLRTFGGSEGVGIATTEAVVGSLFAIIMLNLLFSIFGEIVFPASG